MSDNLTYSQSGVNYNLLDELKRMAQSAAKQTHNVSRNDGLHIKEETIGESACVVESDLGKANYAFVQEGLGTKNLVADEMEKLIGKSYYDAIAQDTVAMIINDLITVGASPLLVTAYWAIGSTKWLENRKRMEDLTAGWSKACIDSGAFWGGGETPILSGIINENTIDLAGSAFGVIKPKERLIVGNKLQAGDAIVVFESSGIHANGITLARKIAEQLPDGYATKLPSGKMYGEALLTPTTIYAKLVNELLDSHVDIHYMANITGHGWRKLMRNSKPFSYRITSLPPVSEIFTFIQEKGPVTEEEMYGNFNMGAGFAIFASKNSVGTIFKSSAQHNIKSYEIGIVETGEKRVIIEPKNIEYKADSLQVKA